MHRGLFTLFVLVCVFVVLCAVQCLVGFTESSVRFVLCSLVFLSAPDGFLLDPLCNMFFPPDYGLF